jgi:H+-transporting ATPase
VEALSFAVVLLVASIPVAIEIVCTTTLALGSHELSSEGAIVSRLAAIEDMAGMTILCSDKTGTLTLNKMQIQEETPIYFKGETQSSLLRYAAMAAKWKDPPRDALDTLVLGAVDLPSMDVCDQVDYMPFDPVVKRTEGTISEKGGPTFKTTKGAPHVILQLCNDPKVEAECEAHVTALGERGIRAMGIAKTDEKGKWRMRGLLTFLDPPRPDTKTTVHKAMEYGMGVKMITGDHLLIAKETARQLDMGTDIHIATNLPMLNKDGSTPDNLMSYEEHILPADGFAQVRDDDEG